MLEVKSIAFSFHRKTVLQNLSFHAKNGEVLTILGANGTGKTTLLKCMLGFYKICAGEILVDGISIKKISTHNMAKHIAYVPQSFSADDGGGFSVMDFILMGRSVHMENTFTKEDEKKVVSVIEEMGLEELALQDVDLLSGGERQRVLIARALAQETETILLDEPTSSLDLNMGVRVLAQLQKIARERSVAVITTMHDVNLASLFSDCILLLHNRSMLAQGSPMDVITEENIGIVYGVVSKVMMLNGVPHVFITRGENEI